jgi:hypothetical protein
MLHLKLLEKQNQTKSKTIKINKKDTEKKKKHTNNQQNKKLVHLKNAYD